LQYGRKVNPYRIPWDPFGVLCVRQTDVVKNNQSVLDQNQLPVLFLNDGAHNIIVLLEFTANLNDDSDVDHCYQDIDTT
jgi:hypothetical protein